MLAPGLEYRVDVVGSNSARVHLVRVDLSKHRLRLLQAADQGEATQRLAELVAGKPILVAINASYFNKNKTANGLVIREGVQLAPLWPGVVRHIFQIVDGRPSIIAGSDYRPSDSRSLAIQGRPSLLVKGEVQSFKRDAHAKRSGICVTEDERVILAVVHPKGTTWKQFAETFKRYCSDAVNFDGGSGVQFYLSAGGREILLPGSAILNALAVELK